MARPPWTSGTPAPAPCPPCGRSADAVPSCCRAGGMFMSDPSRVQLSGPLSVIAAGFCDELEGRGYRPGAAAKQPPLMSRLSRCLVAHVREPAGLDRVQIAQFVAERRTSHAHLASVRGLQVLLGYLRGLCVVPPAGSRGAPTPAGELLERYAEYLRLQRRLKASTIRSYCNHACDFLAERELSVGALARAPCPPDGSRPRRRCRWTTDESQVGLLDRRLWWK